jgi:hypothetical protein
MDKSCSICGNIFHNTVFKGGYVCEDCVAYIKSILPDGLDDLNANL